MIIKLFKHNKYLKEKKLVKIYRISTSSQKEQLVKWEFSLEFKLRILQGTKNI